MADPEEPMDAIEYDTLDEVAGGDDNLWGDFGMWLERRRVRMGLNKRQAAALAKISPSTWSTLEQGGRTVRGEWINPSPEDTTLVRVAKTVGADPFDVFEMVGRRWVEELDPVQLPAAIDGGDEYDYNSRIAQMPDHVRRTIDDIIAIEESRRGD